MWLTSSQQWMGPGTPGSVIGCPPTTHPPRDAGSGGDIATRRPVDLGLAPFASARPLASAPAARPPAGSGLRCGDGPVELGLPQARPPTDGDDAYVVVRPLDVRYESYVDHSPMAVSWSHGAERIVREFPFPIVAAGSLARP